MDHKERRQLLEIGEAINRGTIGKVDGFKPAECVSSINLIKIREFWGKCGFREKRYRKPACTHEPRCTYWVDSSGNGVLRPENIIIDLNNLFKYAESIAIETLMNQMNTTEQGAREVLFSLWLLELKEDKDPAQALKKAIEQIWEDK